MKKLYLVWYEPDKLMNLIGILTEDNNIYTFEYITEDNKYNDLQLFSNFGLFPGFDDYNEIYTENHLFPNIVNRLPNKNRPDYQDILKVYGVVDQFNDFEILEKTKAKNNSDFFQFITEEEYWKLKKQFN